MAVTLCEFCMPEAFCGLETVRQKAPWTLCALWEKNLYKVCKQAYRGNLTYYAPPCGGGVGGGATILWARKDDCLSDTDSENEHINRLNDVAHQALQPYCCTPSSCVIGWLSDVCIAISFAYQCPSRSEHLIGKQTDGRLRPPMTGNIRSKARLLSIFIRTFVKSVLSLFRLFSTLNKAGFTIRQATEQPSFVPLLLCVFHSAHWGIRRKKSLINLWNNAVFI